MGWWLASDSQLHGSEHLTSPLINAMEVYKIKDFPQSSTKQGDGIFFSYPYISPYNLVIREQGLKMIQLFPCLFPWN